jgi:hypothetical protein
MNLRIPIVYRALTRVEKRAKPLAEGKRKIIGRGRKSTIGWKIR